MMDLFSTLGKGTTRYEHLSIRNVLCARYHTEFATCVGRYAQGVRGNGIGSGHLSSKLLCLALYW